MIRRHTGSLLRYSIIICLLIPGYLVNFILVSNSSHSLHDFGSFIAAGKLANMSINPYSIDSPLISYIQFGKSGIEGYTPNLNPPILVVIFQPLANIDPLHLVTIWRILTFILFIIVVIILQRAYPIQGFPSVLRLIWAFNLAGLWHTIQMGQIYSLLLLLTVVIWLLLKQNKFITAGLFLGVLIAIKPNFVLWAILLLAIGNWRIFLSSGISALAISAIPLMKNGFTIYNQWLEASSIFTRNLLIFPGNNSFQGLAERFGFSAVGIILSIMICVFGIFYVLKAKPSFEKVSALGIVSSLFISPIAWTGYTILTLPIFFERKQWEWPFWIAAGIFSVSFALPLIMFTLSFVFFIFFGWFYGWGLMAVLYGILVIPSKRIDKIAEMTSSIHTN